MGCFFFDIEEVVLVGSREGWGGSVDADSTLDGHLLGGLSRQRIPAEWKLSDPRDDNNEYICIHALLCVWWCVSVCVSV